MSGYLDNSGRKDVLSGGARMIPVDTPAGRYRVWVKRIGNNPGLRVLLLHGGPGATHEYLEACDSYLPYAEQVLMPEMDQGALAEIKSYEASGDIENPRYMELLNEQHYVHHVLRMPVEDWPDPVVRAFAHINPAIYSPGSAWRSASRRSHRIALAARPGTRRSRPWMPRSPRAAVAGGGGDTYRHLPGRVTVVIAESGLKTRVELLWKANATGCVKLS